MLKEDLTILGSKNQDNKDQAVSLVPIYLIDI